MQQITVEVAYATPAKQIIVPLTITINTPIIEVIRLSNINSYFPELINLLNDLSQFQIGIFGKKVNIDYQLQANDRIEIYRPLTKTPNQKRLERVKNNAK